MTCNMTLHHDIEPTGSARADPVEKAAKHRQMASDKAKELIAQMEQDSYTQANDAILDLQELDDNWLECMLQSGKTFFFNTVSGQSVWDRPADLPIPAVLHSLTHQLPVTCRKLQIIILTYLDIIFLTYLRSFSRYLHSIITFCVAYTVAFTFYLSPPDPYPHYLTSSYFLLFPHSFFPCFVLCFFFPAL